MEIYWIKYIKSENSHKKDFFLKSGSWANILTEVIVIGVYIAFYQ